jgi:hypothetical protein
MMIGSDEPGVHMQGIPNIIATSNLEVLHQGFKHFFSASKVMLKL